MKILVCDDNEEQCTRVREAIGDRAEVTKLAGAELERKLRRLFRLARAFLDGDAAPKDDVCGTYFDDFELAIVDNNLTELQTKWAPLTAEAIIGYLRAFTKVPYIVSLNKNPHVDFDLRYLFGDYQSLADLALNTNHLSNPRLWSKNEESEFAPWYWPQLDDAVSRRRRQIKFVAENFEEPVWDALGFPDEAHYYLSRHAEAALRPRDEGEQQVTFKIFFESSRTLVPADIGKLLDGMTGRRDFANAVYRITAYEVDRWIRRDILGTQDVLIDLPHVVSRMPFLLGDRAGDVIYWNETVTAEEPPYSLDEELYMEHLKHARFAKSAWVQMPSFWWPILKSNDSLTDIFLSANNAWADAVFCEDVSKFILVSSDEGEESPQEFQAEVPGSWSRRFILDVGGLQYSPRSRIEKSATQLQRTKS